MEQFIILGTISLLAAVSPWPDFVLATKNNLHWKKWGILTALWIWVACLVHISYCIAWIWLIVSQSILLFNLIKILGAIYLIYLWIQLIRAKKSEIEIEEKNKEEKSIFKFFIEWFLWNWLNPKATLFFLSVFTQVISPETSFLNQISFWIFMTFIITTWFVFYSFFLNFKFIKKKISWFQVWIERIMWSILILLWIKIIFNRD